MKSQKNEMIEFRHSICEPLNPKINEKGRIQKDEIITVFLNFSWNKYLEQVQKSKENEVFYSPSLEIENKGNNNGLTISAVGEPNDYEFYIFFKRPKKRKRFFGFSEKIDNNYVTDLTEQTEKDVLNCLNALIENDLTFLESKFK